MNKTVLVVIMATNGLISGLASAEEVTQASLASLEVKKPTEVYDMIQERGYRCLECHDVDKNVVGPAWKEVAAKRKSHKWAEELENSTLGI
jgi:cytochrome c551/c552